MFPLWDVAIAPALAAIRAKRVVEIGALRGETTVRMLEHLGPDAELHVIDPVPEFDPGEHERRFPGRYVFHRDLSLNVLPTLPAMDAALIDGDHNWYTVRHELQHLADGARRDGRPLPLLVLHDVGWPYGRRDLYYAPEQIPAEQRQPHRQAGMRPGRSKLLDRGGLSPRMWNAEHEGGPRNGVMTALEDFMADHDRPLHRAVLPIYFGLAIVVERERLEREPELVAVLDHLESREGKHELLELAEELRLRAMIFQHNVFYQREAQLERAARRYLGTVAAALLGEHHLEHEARIEHLHRCATKGKAPDADKLRDPVRYDKDVFARLQRQRREGPASAHDVEASTFLPYAPMGRVRLEHLEACLDAIRTGAVGGDLVECGTGRGGGAVFFRAFLEAHELADRHVWVADRFRASPPPDRAPTVPPEGPAGLQADLNLVRDAFARFDLLDDRVRFLVGPLDATLPGAPIERVALLRVGPGLGEESRTALDHLYDRLSVGGFVVVDDLGDPASRKAVEAFRTERGVTAPVEHVGWSALAWRKDAEARPAPTDRAEAAGQSAAVLAPRPPPAPAAPPDTVDLTVVVVFYDMAREARRTLHSLTRAYQQGLDGVTYEVIALDNGSPAGRRITEDAVRAHGPEMRFLDLADHAHPSPVAALNAGIRAGRGRAFALMIDGAHVLTPGVIANGLAGLRTYAPAIVATQQWYVGPGQQGDAMVDGYDQTAEDRLFEEVGWPGNGYGLFDIGHFVGDRDWLDGLWESNCMFVERTLLEQVGCFDESFSMPGGGYANLELYERLGSTPGVNVVTIIGEGSFHQIHGGTTTNQADAAERRSRVVSYAEHYADLRGRRFRGPGKPIHFVGAIQTPAARRSKARRLTAPAFARTAPLDHDRRPETPTPVPDELAAAFTDAVWRNLPWRTTSWLGHQVAVAPGDLLAYQELVRSLQPDWVVATGTEDPGRLAYLASICELTGAGRVLAVGGDAADGEVVHPRLARVAGPPHHPGPVAEVRATVAGGRALVLLGSQTDRARTTAEFEAYAPLVPVGSYVVVEGTVLNGHPVWPGFGPGPAEAVKQILARHGEFVPDRSLEKWSSSLNPGGYLKRVR